MKTILSLFVVLIFVAGCGGGGSETSGTGGTENFNPTTIPTTDGGEDVCTASTSLPRGNHPIEDTPTITTTEGTLTLYSDGTYCVRFSDGLSHCDDWVFTPMRVFMSCCLHFGGVYYLHWELPILLHRVGDSRGQ